MASSSAIFPGPTQQRVPKSMRNLTNGVITTFALIAILAHGNSAQALNLQCPFEADIDIFQ
jgi:hypothetical protein